MTHYAVHLKLIQYRKSTKPQFKKQNQKTPHKARLKDIWSLKLKEAS